MSRTISIAPVTRIEGHARINITLDDTGQVTEARLQVQEYRGFEAFCVGRPFWEMPAITARICGICPVSHALASALAGDRILAVQPPPAAQRLRSLLSLAQLILSHSLSFFHLSAPDIVLGLDFNPAERNIAGLARRTPDLIRKGIRLRQIGQEIVNRVAGGHLHPEFIVPGGMRRPLDSEGRDAIACLLPEARLLADDAVAVWEEHRERFLAEMGGGGELPGLFLGVVGADGCLDHSSGRLRFSDGAGLVKELPPEEYASAIAETVSSDSYLKSTVCTVGDEPFYRVGPLARLHVAPFDQAPRAEQARRDFLQDKSLARSSLGYHQARLIEMCYAVERLETLLTDPLITDPHVLARADVNARSGVGITEAPRGTLIHHYEVDGDGLLTRVNLIVATAHNGQAMDRAITALARQHLCGEKLTEGMLNRVEHGIRLYDPCLSCATHLTGRLGIAIQLRAPGGKVLDSSWL